VPRASFSFTATLWRWRSNTTWVFVTVPPDESDEIADLAEQHGAGGFGSVKVAVRIGTTAWRTSVFPSTEHAGYVLPIKKPVRQAESIEVDDTATVHLDVL
jgi:hypothetical protein